VGGGRREGVGSSNTISSSGAFALGFQLYFACRVIKGIWRPQIQLREEQEFLLHGRGARTNPRCGMAPLATAAKCLIAQGD